LDVSCFIKIPANTTYELVRREVASIILIIHGQGELNKPSRLLLSTGKVFMVPANAILEICVGAKFLELYQAFVNL